MPAPALAFGGPWRLLIAPSSGLCRLFKKGSRLSLPSAEEGLDLLVRLVDGELIEHLFIGDATSSMVLPGVGEAGFTLDEDELDSEKRSSLKGEKEFLYINRGVEFTHINSGSKSDAF